MRAAGSALTVGELLKELEGVDERLPVRLGGRGTFEDDYGPVRPTTLYARAVGVEVATSEVTIEADS